mmetsp:Transcript_4814/g.9658  ORF Transcript_4814/g.9658 Transcript_4814/m.9658 type:complete len:254 (-) Transcript_4814:5-766(-)
MNIIRLIIILFSIFVSEVKLFSTKPHLRPHSPPHSPTVSQPYCRGWINGHNNVHSNIYRVHNNIHRVYNNIHNKGMHARLVKWDVQAAHSSPLSSPITLTPSLILSSTPSFTSILNLSSNHYQATATQTNFPIVKLNPVMTFECTVMDSEDGTIEGIELKLLDQKMYASGPEWAKRIVIAASNNLNTTSITTFRKVIEGGREYIKGESSFTITMSIPRWVPIPTSTISSRGQDSMEVQIMKDLKDTVGKLCNQ